jgi:DNA-binding CsgD family transcriptional regulator
MTRESGGDLERLSRLLEEFYGAAGLDDFRRRALGVVEREFGGELVCHNELDLRTGDSLSALSQDIGHFAELRPFFFDFIEQHPSVQHHLAADGGETLAVKTSDFLDQAAWRGSGLYAEFYRPLADVRYQLTIGQKFDDTLVFFAVSRRHRDFSEDERRLLGWLRPHFMLAYRNARTQDELRTLRGELQRAGRLAAGDDSLAGRLAERYRLSPREAEVLVEIARGKSNQAVAAALGVQVSTIKTRLESVYRKLGVRNRTAAVLHALALTDPDARPSPAVEP